MPTAPVLSQIRLGGRTVFLLNFADETAGALETHACDVLSRDELTLWRGFPLARKRREWLAGRMAAKAALQADRLERGLEPLPFRTLPVLPDDGRSGPVQSPLDGCLTISHSGTMAAAAHSDTPIGIDIERLRAFTPAVIQQFVSPTESRLLGPCPDDDPRLTLLWSAKEAVLKARRARNLTKIRQIEWRGWNCSGAMEMREHGLPVSGVFAGFWRGHAVAVASARRLPEARAA
ncbi:4'-phosphopantetheinyl transferase family protein [Notoacmeibacter ruber]|uniref:Enterobactin synthase component D n=1 Tax=Notoacmeibacter ruber TaxID=2670375 RepID=A0A3L7J4E3_9HYPH|nr:4'-phosphopantetheinyl transferase superfamily protein [Notoacmeibacter ruber]RLQ85195.1 4'-phosphopantetheinyl transferase superfamily protein [Notoacmeibacter ruber]